MAGASAFRLAPGPPAAVTVNLTNGLADDGEPGEGDEIVSVERVLGGRGPDHLRAIRDSSSRFELFGGPGDDSLFGALGPDPLRGDAGADLLDGDGGNDTLNADDGEKDIVECDAGPLDEGRTDAGEFRVLGCERRLVDGRPAVGRPRLSPA